jgi:hypothetical protein
MKKTKKQIIVSVLLASAIHNQLLALMRASILKSIPYRTTFLASLIALLAIASSARAEIEIYFGEDVSPFWPNNINAVPRIYPAKSLAVCNQFRARLVDAITESFETYTRYSTPTNITFGTTIATLSGNRQVDRVSNVIDTLNGVFPITGTNFLILPVDQVGFFAVGFSEPQAAFGFFGTDFGEFAQMQLSFIGTNGMKTDMNVPVVQPQESGGCFFLGVISRDAPFVRVEFTRIGSPDGFGLDDMIIATAAQVLPAQPATLQVAMRPVLWVGGTEGAHYQIQFTPSLPATNWVTLTNVALPTSPFPYTDLTATNQTRYYRAVPIQ